MAVILGGLMTGYCLRKSGWVAERQSNVINRFALMFIQPLVICLALWMMAPVTWRTLLLPLYGVTLIVALWPGAHLLGRALRLDRPSLGSFVTGSMFSNVGFTYGTFIAYVALGPAGAALGSLYCVSFMPSFFTLGFAVGRRYAPGSDQGLLRALGKQFADPQTRNPVLGIAAGLTLNLLRVPAPASADAIIDVAMPATTAAYLLAIGLGLHLSAVKDYWRECLLAHASKFVLGPIVGLALAAAFGYWRMADRSLLVVTFIQSAAPVAIMTVMLAEVAHLNAKLAGALWITTNVTGVLLAPAILLAARALL
jgi:predicted permease